MGHVAATRVPLALPVTRVALLWAVPLVALSGTAAALVLLALQGRLPAPSEEAWVLTVLPLWTLGGAVLLHRSPGHRLGWLHLLVGGAAAVALVSRAWAGHALDAGPDPLFGGILAAWVSGWAWVLTAVPLVGLLPILLPDGRLPSPAWRPLPVVVAVSAGLLLTANALSPGPLPEWPAFSNPVGLPAAAAPFLDVAGAVGALLVPITALASAAGLVGRWRRSRGADRDRLRLVALCAVPLAASVAWSAAAPSAAATAAVVLSLVLWSTCIAAAAVQHRLFDVDVAVSRTVVWSTVAAVLLGLHVGLVALLGGVAGASLLATATVAVAFAPARELLQRRVNGFLFGRRDDPWASLTMIGQRLEAAGRPRATLAEVADVLAGSLRLASVQVLLAEGSIDVPAATLGPDPAQAGARSHEQPLVHLGERVGALRVAPPPGEKLGRRDLALLAAVAPGMAVVAAAVVAGERVRRSQQDLLTAVEEERRRLRRDLHDGVGPTLTGVAFALEAARNVAASRPDRVRELLDETIDQLHEAVVDLRGAVEGLRPPALDDLGLVAALRERLHVLTASSGIDCSLHVPAALPALPAAVEVSVYRIVVEGVTNVGRHAAGAKRCHVLLHESQGVLIVQVRDDGVGLPQPLRLGAGLVSVQERAAALGGDVRLTDEPGGGSLLDVTLPVAPCRA